MKRHAVGLMTGTSLDGIDAALIEADGFGFELKARVLGRVEEPLGPVRETLRAAASGDALPALAFLRAGRALGERHAEVAATCVERFLPAAASLTLAAAHGQTVCHAPGEGLSWQLLDPGPLAERLGVRVVSDFRQADLLAGGEGAPITPLCDAALYSPGPGGTLVVNLGGVVNATRLPAGGGPPEGGDVCLCNLLLDALAGRAAPGARFDEGGRIAAAGRVDRERARRISEASGFAAAPGRTLGREQVEAAVAAASAGATVPADALAASVDAIARAVGGCLRRWPAGRVVLAGGGVRNGTLVAAIREGVAPTEVRASGEVGVPSQAREAAAMAVLGLLSIDRSPTTVPRITGAAAATVGGRWCGPSSPAAPPRGGPEAQLAGAERLDAMEAPELLSFLHAGDAIAVAAVTPLLPELATLVGAVAEAQEAGGRLVYLGAGTSGRLGVLDASELPPTFSVPASETLARIAGGDGALRRSAEGAEDDPGGAIDWMTEARVGVGDVVLGIAASGQTPFVHGGLAHARAAGAETALLSCTPGVEAEVDHLLLADTGPEAIAGSTRMRAGTATKLVLNLLSTAVMIRRGKCWGGWMVDLRASNAKLRRRAERILVEAGGVAPDRAASLLSEADGRVKVALTMHGLGVGAAEAEAALAAVGGRLRSLLGSPPRGA